MTEKETMWKNVKEKIEVKYRQTKEENCKKMLYQKSNKKWVQNRLFMS